MRGSKAFTADEVFMDVEGPIKPGDDFTEVINAQVAAADVVLVVMGPQWIDLLTARAGAGVDHVVTEIEAALEQRKRVIPVRVGGAGMPRADLLPGSIRPLANLQAVELRKDRFRPDCKELVTALREYLAALERGRATRREAERAAADAERKAAARMAGLKRPAGTNRRGLLRGAAAAVTLAMLIAAIWWGFEQWRLRDSLRGSFKDCDTCPEMVVIPAGEFTMGSNDISDEKPPHRVTIRQPFAVGKFAVTFDEWDACAEAGGCSRYRPDDLGWGRGKRPVINVSWNDAKSYAAWLSAKSGQRYRLLSEAEWEYAARAGSLTKYPWGDDIGVGNANCRDCESQSGGKQTARVGSFPPNSWGLYDMHGNVWQWVEDRYYDTYDGMPSDGSVWADAGSFSRVVRGGSWSNDRQDLRSANRDKEPSGSRGGVIGFRVARTLAPQE
jgi:formylglycine-generating enzyme required for sulfatase activity